MHTSATNALSAWVVIAGDLAESAEEAASELPQRALAALVLIGNRPAVGSTGCIGGSGSRSPARFGWWIAWRTSGC